jgi:hypothetical protein
VKIFMTAIVLASLGTPLTAQWAQYRTPGIPRTADGKPNLAEPRSLNMLRRLRTSCECIHLEELGGDEAETISHPSNSRVDEWVLPRYSELIPGTPLGGMALLSIC